VLASTVLKPARNAAYNKTVKLGLITQYSTFLDLKLSPVSMYSILTSVGPLLAARLGDAANFSTPQALDPTLYNLIPNGLGGPQL